MRLALRPYRPEDFESLYTIDQSCYPPGIAYSKRDLAYYLRLPGADCLIAKAVGEKVGFILSALFRTEGHIITIDVLEKYRKLGAGSELLAAAEKRLAERGCTEIVLETAINNAPAISFWKRHGYLTQGILEAYYPGGIDAFSMSKVISRLARRERKKSAG